MWLLRGRFRTSDVLIVVIALIMATVGTVQPFGLSVLREALALYVPAPA
ncbi:MAG TPA: hypothetical protein VJ645_07035 [Gaiellaceae bacterium]|nr:hypothetical protein [Gaiellaceae bacterium]